MGMFDELRRAKELGLNLTTVLVKVYLDEHGHSPLGQIAKACNVSIRSVERAIALLKSLGFFNNQKTTSMTHDHDKHFSKNNRTASDLTGHSDGLDAPAQPDRHAGDPLAQQLLAAEVLPWCVDILLAKVDRTVIERQLAYHAHRVAAGYRFKSHPAKFLFAACLNDYMPPQDFHAARQKPAHAPAPTPAAAGREATGPGGAPARVEEAPVELTRSGAMTVIRMGIKSKLPTMRQEALRLARVWDVDLRELGAPPDLLAEAASA
jgi:hypothetical protein